MKARINRTVEGYKSTKWIPEGTIVDAEPMINNKAYWIIYYVGNTIIIPSDAVEVLREDD